MALNEPHLGCGRAIDNLWDTINDPPNQHETTCPDCQAARTRLRRLALATQAMINTDTSDPNLQPSSRVKSTVMQVARAEVRRGSTIPLRQRAFGSSTDELKISEQAIASVVRATTDTLPGIHARRCAVELINDHTTPPATTARVPSKIKISLRVSVAAHLQIPAAIQTLREHIAEDVSAAVGVTTQIIDVVVEDVYDA